MKKDKEAPAATSFICFEVEDLDETYRHLKDRDVAFVTEPREQGWGGRTAAMLDPNNNIIVLSEV